MELCKSTLREYFETRNYSGFPFEITDELHIFKQILKGLKHIHENDIIHGDLNPMNIFFGDKMEVKIGDFGLSKKTDDKDNFIDSDSYGNVLYMSPETELKYLINKKSDIYSIGIIYYETIKGFKTQMERMQKINEIKKENFENCGLDKVHINFIKNMLQKDSTERPNIYEIKDDFKEVIYTLTH